MIHAYAKMLPRLQAEEALMRAQIAFASNERHLEDRDQMRLMGQLERQAGGGRTERPTAESLGDMGIVVEEG